MARTDLIVEPGSSLTHHAIPCEHCGQMYVPSKRGRPSRYCSDKCKTAAYRRRKLWRQAEARAEAYRNVAARPGEEGTP